MLVRKIEELSDMLIRYDYTANLSRGNWAWEFARRNPDLRDDAFAVLPQHGAGSALVVLAISLRRSISPTLRRTHRQNSSGRTLRGSSSLWSNLLSAENHNFVNWNPKWNPRANSKLV
jgi:hypothetical protein